MRSRQWRDTILRLKSFAMNLVRGLSLTIVFCACSGPPETSTEGSETPASLQLVAGTQTQFTGLTETVAQSFTLELQNLSATVPATALQFSSNLIAPFSFTGGSYPGTNGSCADTLSPGGTCSIEIEVLSLSSGTFLETLAFNYNDGIGVQIFEFQISAEVNLPPVVTPLGGWQLGLTHTLASGGNQRVLVFLHAMDIANADSDLIQVTYGGQSLNQVAEVMTSSGYRSRVEVWVCNEVCLSGVSGNNFDLTYDNSAVRYPNNFSVLLSNVNQASSIVDVQTAALSSTSNLFFSPLAEVEGGLSVVNGAHGDLALMDVDSDGVSSSQSIMDQTDTDDSQMRQIAAYFTETEDSPDTTYSIEADASQRMVGIAISFRPQ